MQKNKPISRQIVISALIAAAYVALTLLSSAFGLAYGSIQFRLSEALNVLAVFTPAAVPGLTIGCLISNLGSPFGPIDVILGTLATLLATITIRLIATKTKALTIPVSILSPTLFNSIIIGLEFSAFSKDAWLSVFFITALQVAIGEIAVCTLLGLPLYFAIKKSKLDKLL